MAGPEEADAKQESMEKDRVIEGRQNKMKTKMILTAIATLTFSLLAVSSANAQDLVHQIKKTLLLPRNKRFGIRI